MILTRTWCLGTLFLGYVASAAAGATPYAFSLDASQSGFLGKASARALTSGTLIGDYDVDTNPTGTRTKPGILGSFGATENVDVPVTLGPELGGDVDSSAAGGFQMSLDLIAGTVELANYEVDLLADGPVSLPASVTLEYSSFRSRSPDSLFIGGIPIAIPIGSADLVSLRATQAIAGSVGTLTPAGPNAYDFTVATVVQLEGEFTSPLGSTTIPGIPLPLVIQGQLSLSGLEASLLAMTPLMFDPTANPNMTIPQFGFGLPTILPPGGTANVLFDLSLSEIATSLVGTQTLVANGRLIPEPACAGWLLVATMIMARCRRK